MTFSSAKKCALVAGLAIALAVVPATVACADSQATGGSASALTADLLGSPTPATFTEDELDTVVGAYTYDGKTYEITARAAIEDSMSLESDLVAEGVYAAPSADLIVAYARNRILDGLVQEQGITVSDEELASYALQTLGTDDIAAIAQYYGMDEEQARAILLEAASVVKLRDEVVGQLEIAPQAPVAPDEGDAAAATESYASYILDLVGQDWDAGSSAWDDAASVYAQALPDFDGKSATFEEAQTAYYLAYSLYQQTAAQQLADWQSYANEYLGQATIQVGTLRS